MLDEGQRMEILEAYDLTGSFASAAGLCGVDPKTVKRYVSARDAGVLAEMAGALERPTVADPFAEKIREWIKASHGRIRADRVHEKLLAMGYEGSTRTTRRVVAVLKQDWAAQSHRLYKPWVVEPGLWLQFDYGDGPVVDGVKTVLFCAWLPWSRYRVILALRDKTLPSVIASLDRTFRLAGGVPTYALTDNEKTVTERHVARIPVRNPQIVSAGAFYGVTITTCVPHDPESKGGSEATVRIAKADLVPTDANLLAAYGSWDALETACRDAMDRFNGRVHTMTGEIPTVRLEREREALHRVPAVPYTATFGETRNVSWSCTISFRGARYSVPHTFAGKQVWVRVHGDELVIVGAADTPAELARHSLVGRGQTSLRDEHYPERLNKPRGPLTREPKATNGDEAAFLTLGEGAKTWLIEAAAAGARQIDRRMADAVALARIWGDARVDAALGVAAVHGRFADGDLTSILAAPSGGEVHRLDDTHSLQPGTAAWARLDGSR